MWERNHMELPTAGGRIILRWILRKWDGGVKWIDLARDSDRWQTLVTL
jgi:hypothetical protein